MSEESNENKESIREVAMRILSDPDAIRMVRQRRITREGAAKWAKAFAESIVRLEIDEETGSVVSFVVGRAAQLMNASLLRIDVSDAVVLECAEHAARMIPDIKDMLDSLDEAEAEASQAALEAEAAELELEEAAEEAAQAALEAEEESADESSGDSEVQDGDSVDDSDTDPDALLDNQALRAVLIEDLVISKNAKTAYHDSGLTLVGDILDVSETQDLADAITGIAAASKDATVGAIKALANEDAVKANSILQD